MLLDGGMADVFAEIFGGEYLPARLHRTAWAQDAKGKVTRTPDEGDPILLQVDRLTWKQSQPDQGAKPRDVRLIILARNAAGAVVAAPEDGQSVTLDDTGVTYRLAMVERDAASSHWEARGTPTSAA
jgi:hypothetical protein